MEKCNNSANPLLRAMAQGPIEWRYWNAATLERAQKLDRPLCVCVVNATSRWSYAMKDNFDDKEIVALLNNDYIPVLCDASASPHVTQAARAMAQIMLGHAGWPLFLFLTPLREPIFASAYMPRQSASTKTPGLLEVLRRIKWLWLMKRPQINEAAASYAVQMREALSPCSAPMEKDLLHRTAAQLKSEADADYGGWGERPKFPQAPKMALSAWLCRHMPEDEKMRGHLRRTLSALCLGGLHDPLEGGFHDYCRDREWIWPYLGKHVGQNAALCLALMECLQTLGEESVAGSVFDESINFILRRFDRGDGLLCAGESLSDVRLLDRYYLWDKAEADAALGQDSSCLGMTKEGNYLDPLTGRQTGLNLPFFGGAAKNIAAWAKPLAEAREERLLPPLEERVRLLDNAMIAALSARAARKMGEPEWLAVALRIIGRIENCFILDGTPANALYGDTRGGDATLEDMSSLVWAYLELFRATDDSKWLDTARKWTERCGELFGAEGALSLAASSDHELLPAWDAGDDFMFSGAGIMLNNLVTLLKLTGDNAWKKRAESLISAFGGALNEYPASCAGLTLGVLRLESYISNSKD